MTFENETWKPVVGYEGRYDVSSIGRVRSYLKWRKNAAGVARQIALKPFEGHNRVTLSKDGKARTLSVHRLVAFAFIGAPEPGLQVCHNNGNGLDNRVENLRWDTPKSNTRDSFLHGAIKVGSVRTDSKLTEENVAEIRARAATQSESLAAISRRFGVHRSTVVSIVNLEKWRHTVTEEERANTVPAGERKRNFHNARWAATQREEFGPNWRTARRNIREGIDS